MLTMKFFSLVFLMIVHLAVSTNVKLYCDTPGVCLVHSYFNPFNFYFSIFQNNIFTTTFIYYCFLQSQTLSGTSTETMALCWKFCQETQNCKWMSFSLADKNCVAYQHCREIMEMNDYITSQVECTYPDRLEKYK